jgi:regulator of cell morphogenesis and NO signaling
VRSLLKGEKTPGYQISIFRTQHDQIEARLNEFKNILIKYYPAKSTNTMNGVLFNIFNCEDDLASHNAVENRLFVPVVAEYERKCDRK